MLREPLHLRMSLEGAGIHNAHADEHEILECASEETEDVEQGVQAQTVESVDQQDGGAGAGIKMVIHPPS